MEKLRVGWQMSTSYTDPPIVLMGLVPCLAVSTAVSCFHAHQMLFSTVFEHTACSFAAAILPWALLCFLWHVVYHGAWCTEHGVDTSVFVVWKHPTGKLATHYRHRRIPIGLLYECYLKEELSWNPECENGDCYLILQKHRAKFVNYKVCSHQILWLFTQFLPVGLAGTSLGTGSSSGKTVHETEQQIHQHYDRGNQVFRAMLGKAMVYTCALFEESPSFASDAMYNGDYARSAGDYALEVAQSNKMRVICEKLGLQEGDELLDIGCGWGTLLRFSRLVYGATSTGVTLSVQGKRYCEDASLHTGVSTKTLLCDYRDIPDGASFDKIASIEMAEHVGLCNFVHPYLSSIRKHMKSPNSRFLLQVSGLRQGASWEDVAWGLFMSKYIFPGADASTPLHWYVRQCELAGFEVLSVENIGGHYSHTLHKWYDNWMAHKEEILSGDIDAISDHSRGTHMFRLQEFFLAWSTIAAAQGTATCYQLLLRPNLCESTRFQETFACDNAMENFTHSVSVMDSICMSHSAARKADLRERRKSE